MRILQPPSPVQDNYDTPPQQWRDYNSLRGVAINAEACPILSRHWPGALIVGGRLACHDDSPLARRFATKPVVQIEEPDSIGRGRHDDVGELVLARLAPETTDEAA